MTGEGLFALEKTELLSVPMFGPLSPLVSGVLNDRRAGFERAKSAFCNFRIKDGILSTQDFRTTTTSLVFVGDGSVDLKEQTLDMTMRMNARGLLGLITLPLRPFYGMFQFRGTGPLKDPQVGKRHVHRAAGRANRTLVTRPQSQGRQRQGMISILQDTPCTATPGSGTNFWRAPQAMKVCPKPNQSP